jgi:DNA-binding transcriptional LysR family regulator
MPKALASAAAAPAFPSISVRHGWHDTDINEAWNCGSFVLSEAARARAEVNAAAGVPRGQIRLGATQTASGSLDLAGLLGEFRRLFPDVTVTITAGPRQELVADVAEGDLDLALAAEGALAPDGTRFQPLLADEPLLAVVAPDDPWPAATRCRWPRSPTGGRAWNFGQVRSCAATSTPLSGRPGSAGRSRSNWAS